MQSYVIFIVRDDRPCDLLFQCSDMTWQAYNSWPTNEWSLYHNDENGYTGYKKRKKWSTNANDTGWVSFDRPYAQFCMDHLVKNPKSQGSGEFLLWEFPLSYWIEQQGYDVSYISNVDTHRHGPRLQRAKGFISVGHDEYWTREMYDNVSAARDAGVNLAFLSGNSVWGVVPLLPSAEGQSTGSCAGKACSLARTQQDVEQATRHPRQVSSGTGRGVAYGWTYGRYRRRRRLGLRQARSLAV